MKCNQLLILILGFTVLIYLVSIWDNHFYLEGDWIFPLNPVNNILKSASLWEVENGGFSFFRYFWFIWQLPFFLLNEFHFSALIAHKIIILLLLVSAYVFPVLSVKELIKNNKNFGLRNPLLVGILFALNPVFLMFPGGYSGAYGFPIAIFFYLKFLNTKNPVYLILFALTVNFAFFRDFPQIKLFLVFLIALVFLSVLYKAINPVPFKKYLKENIIIFTSFILINAFVLIPFLEEISSNTRSYSVIAETGLIFNADADLGSASLVYIPRFFNSNLINNASLLGKYLSHPIFVIWSFLLWGIIIISIISDKSRESKKIKYLLLLAVVFFVFMAKGANPPFGNIYRFALLNIPYLIFFRTTAALIVGGVLFYSFLTAFSLEAVLKGRKPFFFVLIHIIILFPMYFGVKFLHPLPDNSNLTMRGYPIPQNYYTLGTVLDRLKDDSKILSLPLDNGYVYKDWGYIGSSPLSWITKKPLIHGYLGAMAGSEGNADLTSMTAAQACYWNSIHNIGYLLNEKDAKNLYIFSDYKVKGIEIYEDSYFKLLRVDQQCFLPHIYSTGELALVRFAEKIRSPFFYSGPRLPYVNYGTNQPDYLLKFGRITIEGKVENLKTDVNSTLVYSFYVPADGLYKFYSDSLSAINQAQIDGKTVSIDQPAELKKANYNLTISHSLNHKMKVKWLSHSVSQATLGIEPPSNPTINLPLIYASLDNLSRNTDYIIKIKLTGPEGGKAGILIDQENLILPGRKPPYKYIEPILASEIPAKHLSAERELKFHTGQNASRAKIFIYNLRDITVENIEIYQINNPKIYLVASVNRNPAAPKTKFTKINPVKYLVRVSDIRQPFFLIFSETFHPGWTVIKKFTFSDHKNLSFLGGIFGEDERIISKKNHFQVNGNLNGWYIDPKAINGKNDLELVVEYLPERLYYFSWIISLAVIMMLLVLSIRHVILKKLIPKSITK